MSAGEAMWACGFVLMCAGGLAFRVLPCDRAAALRGVAAGVGMALWVAAVMLVHFWPR